MFGRSDMLNISKMFCPVLLQDVFSINSMHSLNLCLKVLLAGRMGRTVMPVMV